MSVGRLWKVFCHGIGLLVPARKAMFIYFNLSQGSTTNDV